MDFKKIALFSDLDGTLFDDSCQVSLRNQRAIQDFVQRGGLFCVSTGRTPENAWPFVSRIAVNGPGIFLNGAAVYDYKTKSFLQTYTLNDHILRPFLERLMDQFPWLNIQVYNQGNICFITPKDQAEEWFIREHQPCCFFRLDQVEVPWLKILIQGKPEQLAEAEGMIKEAAAGNSEVVYSNPQYLEILPQNVSKGRTLKVLAEDPLLSGRRLAAVGDYYNDLQLLENADISGAPANAPKDIQEKADVVLCSNNDGAVADFIQYLDQL